jgi:hypothetical protein
VATYLHFLAERARSGRLLVTSRHPGTEQYLGRIPIGPLSPAETHKLLMRLPRLSGCDVGAIATVLRVIGGHPRMLEFLDALLRGGEGRFPAVSEKPRDIAKGLKLDLATAPSVIENAMHTALVIAADDVLLDESMSCSGLPAARGPRKSSCRLQCRICR